MGKIAELDGNGETITFQDQAGKQAVYALIDNTHYYKQKHVVTVVEFHIGDRVVLHLRHARNDGTLQVTECADPESWDWLDGLRHSTTSATIQAIEDDTLTVMIDRDALPLTYTLGDSTLWYRGGHPATAADFKVGDKVSIAPRALPGGSILASVIADSPVGAAQGKERKSTSVHGTVQSLDRSAHTLTLKTEAGDTRLLTYEETTELRKGSKTLSLTTLKVGQHVGVRIKHDEADREVVWRVTLETTRRRTTAKGRKP